MSSAGNGAPPLDSLERLTQAHVLDAFEGGPDDVGDQAGWLKSKALANDRDGYTRTVVACFPGTNRIGAFFGVSSAVVARSDLPKRAQPHGTPRIIPAALIGRLALHADLQGRGLGIEILIAAIKHCVAASEQIAFRVIIVDAASPKARRLYEKLDFQPISNLELPNRLFLPVSTAAALITPLTGKQ